MKEKEILAPAGSEAAFVAAVENGADAIYLGGKAFNARSYADNFEPEDIRRLCRYAHLLGARVFITLNILILPGEIRAALDYARELAMAGVDALIVQDVGLAGALSRMVSPEVEIHASTQMTLMNSWGLEFAGERGCRRVVLAREVSADNIRRMSERSPMLLETFGHGALCSGWSGQCLMSSMLGGRSGNRGQCAQPCRLKYQLVDESGKSPSQAGAQGQHLLSTKDLCAVEFLEELLAAGVTSFKLEGRMKQPEYVAMITRQYSEALADAESGKGAAEKKRRRQMLSRCFNRGFTSGYYLRRPGSHLMSRQQPNNQSQVDEELRQIARDSFKAPGCRRRREILAELTAVVGQPIRLALWTAAGSYADPEGRCRVEVASEEPCQAAKERGPGPEELLKQLNRFGSTLFRLKDAKIHTDGQVFAPASLLNQLRRRAVLELEEAILGPWRREESFAGKMSDTEAAVLTELAQVRGGAAADSTASAGPIPRLTIAVDTREGLEAALMAGVKEIYLGGQGFRGRRSLAGAGDIREAVRDCRAAGARAWWTLPRFIHEEKTAQWQKIAERALESGADGLLTGNPGGLILARRLGAPRVAADWPMNLCNDLSLALMKDYGVSRACLSPELTLQETASLGVKGLEKEAFIHGRLALMITEHCLPGTLLGQKREGDCSTCSMPCQKTRWFLKDRLNFQFPLYPDLDCRNWIYNAKTHCLLERLDGVARAGVSHLRIDACQEDPAWISAVCAAYQEALGLLASGGFSKVRAGELKKTLEKVTPRGFTAGHYFRGVE